MNWYPIYKRNIQINLNEGAKDFIVLMKELKPIFYTIGFLFIPIVLCFIGFFYYIFIKGIRSKAEDGMKSILMVVFLIFHMLLFFSLYSLFP